jgi:hypothetical protein
MGNGCKFFVGKPEGYRPLWKQEEMGIILKWILRI